MFFPVVADWTKGACAPVTRLEDASIYSGLCTGTIVLYIHVRLRIMCQVYINVLSCRVLPCDSSCGSIDVRSQRTSEN